MRILRAEAHEDEALMARVAWLYYVAELNQEATAQRLGITRARVNKLLSDARDSGLVSIQINDADVGMLPVEQTIRAKFALEFCVCTPALLGPDTVNASLDSEDSGVREASAARALLQRFAFRGVGMAAAAHLKRHLENKRDAVVGTGWGRTLQQMTLNLAGVSAPRARFISLMGSLTANSSYNPFEVVHAFARTTGGEGYVLPVPFIADTAAARDVLLSQQIVQQALKIARSTTVAYVSIGELTERSLLRTQGMISAAELDTLRSAGAIGDTNGLFFDAKGRPVEHSLNERTLALGFDDLRKTSVVALVAGIEKRAAARAFLASGVARGLIIDGDTALDLVRHLD